ncbi:MAG: nucleotidyltransferase substrate binding protein [Deferribacteraceae bacterium]|jgi:nucleotidyltransferase substrate binding protein (TIGR01987 family)|nr:nucleotidyltransferase substrate binding protein [Deferribacteraceae bacterium]
MHSELRWRQRFQNYETSLVELRGALEKTEYTKLERAGLIQLFEISFELAWKTVKDLLSYEGYTINSPKETLRQAFASGIIIEGELWLNALDTRNLFSHTYNNQLAEEAVALIKDMYTPLLFALEATLKSRLQ